MTAYWVNLSKRGEKDGVFGGLAGLLQGISGGRSLREIPVLPDSFTQIYILFLIGLRIGPPKTNRRFRIGLPKIHRRFRIGPPEIYRRFCIGPPEVTLSLLLPEFHSRWILVYHGYYERKSTKLPIWNRMYPYSDERRDILSNIPIRLKNFQRAKPKGTPEGEGVYLTLDPESSPNTDSISF